MLPSWVVEDTQGHVAQRVFTLVPAACGCDAIQVNLPAQQASFTYLQQPNYGVAKLYFFPDERMKSLPNNSPVPL